MKFAYPVLLTPDPDGGFVVSCRDLPEAITQGETEADAVENAEGAVQAAIEFRIEKELDIPAPSRARTGEVMAAVPVLTALKAALFRATSGKRGAKTALARALGIDEKEVRRMLDPRHATKAATIEHALAVLGFRLVISLEKAA
ncbi:MAG TPA: type II toxin-antitoxin system HicB family antitoxin [Candidatus Ozemobacteraceae bacterium]|nr:type II toxin-antitoxin system HicB family antitoxin [Candidatus Ozemobacteraceae bacterium]